MTSFLRIIVLVLSIGLLASCTSEKDKKEAPPAETTVIPEIAASTQEMIQRIQQIKNVTNFRNHPYESAQKLKLLRQEIENAKAANSLQPNLYIEYGINLLDAGHSQEAIDVFEDIMNRMPENKAITQTNKGLHDALALGYLRLGEQLNCQENHSTESCLFPIKGNGIHTNKAGSQKAIDIYKNILALFPQDLQSKWLLNLAYMTLGEYPSGIPSHLRIPPSAFEPDYQLPVFENVSMYLGIDVNDLAGGVIADDFNNDGFIDIIASSWGMFGQLHYFKNDGAGNFINETSLAGLKGLTGGLNLIQGDYNNDGFLDIYVMRGAWSGFKWMGQLPNSLLQNNGDGTFTDVTIASGLYHPSPTQSSVWLDANADGWLDLFVANETHSLKEPNACQLFINKKDGTFIDVAPEMGLDFTEYIKGVGAGDINNDGWPELYISSINSPNKLLLNTGGGTENWAFENIATTAGTEEPQDSFPTWFFDYNNDGWEDLFVSSFDIYSLKRTAQEVAADYLGIAKKADSPRLYQNQRNNSFGNQTKAAQLDKVLPTMGCNYGDLDNDGYLDFYLGTGAPDYRAIVPNRMFRSNQGTTFQDVTYAGNFGHIQKGHGIAFADFDNDGDQDIYAVMGGSVSGDVFQNAFFENPGNNAQWITLRLKGTASNKSAIGARVKVTALEPDGTERNIYHTICSGGSFGANSLQAEIGLGSATSIKNIAVSWPNGSFNYENYGSAPVNRIVSLEEGNPEIRVVTQPSFEFLKVGHSQHNH